MAEPNDDKGRRENTDPVYAAHGVTSNSVLFLVLFSILQISSVVGLIIVNTVGYLHFFDIIDWDIRLYKLDIVLIALSVSGYFKVLAHSYKTFFGTATFPAVLVWSALDIAATLMIVSTVALWLIR